MLQSRYLIIPTPKKNITCSSCGKEIEGIPYYTKVARFFTCINNNDDLNKYFGLSLGTPMCKDCCIKIFKKLLIFENVLIYSSLALFIVTILLFINAYNIFTNENSAAETVEGWICAVIGVGLAIYVMYTIQLTEIFKNKKMKKYCKDELAHPYEFLRNNGWIQVVDASNPSKAYTSESLKYDLEKICRDGKLSIWDISKEEMVDFNEPESLQQIYTQSIWFAKKYEVD